MTHPLDGNTHAINRHLADLENEVGVEDGQTCGRFHEPDEDAPRGYRPKPCQGVMEGVDGFYVCDTCGEIA